MKLSSNVEDIAIQKTGRTSCRMGDYNGSRHVDECVDISLPGRAIHRAGASCRQDDKRDGSRLSELGYLVMMACRRD